jgi:alkylhydroperoxidase/carboxymuconolactone decarboxylase family protein YurZ
MGRRSALDTRTRMLVLVGQFTMAKSHASLEDAVRAALAAGVAPREVLEIILQCIVYGGHAAVDPAIQVFHKVAEELGLLEELRKSQLPLDGRDRERSYEEEKKTWHPDDVADPRCAPLVERHGWLAVGRGLTLRPHHHINVLAWLDKMDPEFAGLWVRFCYGALYARGVVDDKTRILCMVGDCLAIGESIQARGHMRGAMRNGASPREVLEVILQSCVNFGMPGMMHALEIFVQVMAEEGRLDEIGNPPKSVGTFHK